MSQPIRLALVACLALIAIAAAVPCAADVSAVCPACGAAIPADALFCPECGRPAEAPGVYCWRCGHRADAGDEFCTRCGARVTTTPPEATAAEATPAPAPTSPETTAVVPPPPRKSQPQLRLTTDTTLFPPMMFSIPTGEILPSLAAHAASGWTFGFSDEKRASRWALSAGLGGVGEVTLTSATVTHITDPESDALAGFRVRVPTAWLGGKAGERLSAAWNLAATGENDYGSGSFTASDGTPVDQLSYRYRETTTGMAVTYRFERVKLHGLLHATDFRATNLNYASPGSQVLGADQKIVYANFGLGFEYAADAKTHLLWEVRTEPQVRFTGPSTGKLTVSNKWQTTAGIRFFPVPLLGLDAFVGVDEGASGLADADIGFALHFVVAPSLRRVE